MRFAAPYFLFASLLSVVVALLLVFGAVALLRSVRRFGDQALIEGLLTGRSGGRRAAKGALLVLAVALAFVALAEPQYGRGTRLIPATNLDVVLVLDYSKSMYARDVTPYRIERAKAEVSRLISELPGARFAAVAFAGQPMSFPLTSDGNAIAQFFRQLTPHDMPVGGTAIARALEAGRALLERDPLSKHHRRVMVLVTDGEDLQGDPVSVAAAAREQGITIYVVQIGGRTPEPLPDVTAAGEFRGYRTDESGLPMTTSLTAEGEAQLTQIAESTGGRIVQSQRGETGIREVAHALRQLMTEELSERVETVYANVFMYPLGAALLLLVIECFIGETPRRAKPTMVPPPRKARRPKKARGPATTALGLCLLLLALVGCRSVDKLFERHVPVVDEAIAALDAGDARAAAGLLEEYLSTGKCDQGNIGAPDGLTERANASFDLGLALFSIGESFGKRFGEEPGVDAGADPAAQAAASARSEQVDCALRIVRIIAQASSTPPELKARAYYLAGNLEFLRHRYQAAVEQYDLALRWIPGMEDGGDGTGRDAAHNRAIALERLERQQEPPDAGADASPDASAGDSGSDSGQNDGGPETPDASDDPSAKPDGGRPDGSEQQQKDPPKPNDQEQKRPEQQAQGEPSKSQDDRILDMLEAAPSLQQEAQKRQGAQRGHLGMEDK